MSDTNDTSVPRGSSSPDPGLSGAIKDAIGAIAKTVAPKSISQIKARNDQAIDKASGEQRLDEGRYESP